MSVLDDLRALRGTVQRLSEAVEANTREIAKHEEQIGGQGGLVNAVREVARNVQEVRTILNRLLFAAITFSFGLTAVAVTQLLA